MADARWWIYYCSKSKKLHYYGLAQTRNLCRYNRVPVIYWLSWFVQFQSRRRNWISRWWLWRGSWMTSRSSISDSIICWYVECHSYLDSSPQNHDLLLHAVNNIPVLKVKVIQRGWKLQVLVPIQRGHQVWSRSFMQPLHTHDHPRVHCWISNKHWHSEWTVCIQRWPATLSRHMHLFLWRISTICQPRQCRSNSNQDRTSPFHMSLSSECYVLVLAGNWASVTWSDGGEGHLKGSIRPNNPKAASQRYTESHMQWSVGVPSSKLTERVELHV